MDSLGDHIFSSQNIFRKKVMRYETFFRLWCSLEMECFQMLAQNSGPLIVFFNGKYCTVSNCRATALLQLYNIYIFPLEQYMDFFFDQILNKITVINEDSKYLCYEEFDDVIEKIASNKSLGPDGLTANFNSLIIYKCLKQ